MIDLSKENSYSFSSLIQFHKSQIPVFGNQLKLSSKTFKKNKNLIINLLTLNSIFAIFMNESIFMNSFYKDFRR